MRSLAAFVDDENPQVLAVFEISPGDALALATRFDRQWAYRGGQALFWTNAFANARCETSYLPLHLRLPFERRAVVRIDADFEGRSALLCAARLARHGTVREREIRALREKLEPSAERGIVFVQSAGKSDVGLPGFRDAVADAAGTAHVFVSGFAVGDARRLRPPRGLGAPAIVTLTTV